MTKAKAKKKSKAIEACKATASGGALVCALELGHAGAHSTAPKGKKVAQHATWALNKDGTVTVSAFSGGKSMGSWPEDAPVAPAPSDEPRNDVLEHVYALIVAAPGKDALEIGRPHRHLIKKLEEAGRIEWRDEGWYPTAPRAPEPGPDDDSDDPHEDEIRSDEERDFARCMREDREAHAAALEQEPTGKGKKRRATTPSEPEPGKWGPISCTNETLRCKSTFVRPDTGKPLKPELRCDLEGDHAGKHRAPAPEGNHVTVWDERPGGVHVPLKKYDDARDREVAPAPSAVEPSSAPTRIGGYEIHPAAALFPLIGGAEYEAFVEDIRTHGQRKRVVRIGELILDGRNRLRACLEIGIEPKFREFGDEPGDGADPIAFVISENVARRHLNETQRAFVGAELVPLYEAQAKERQRAAGRQKGSLNLGEAQKGKATEHAAKAVNVSPASVEAALKVKRDAAPEVLAAAKERGHLKVSAAADLATLPKQKQREIVEKVGDGEIRAGKVRALVRQEKKREVVQRINRELVAPMPVGPFGLIVVDYPWPYANSDQHEGSRGHLPYPPMPMAEIHAHAAEAAKRAADDCVLGLWVTNAHLLEVGGVLEAWGFAYQVAITWDKVHVGMGISGPRGQTEHLIIAYRGKPAHTLNELTTLIRAPREPGHSKKPDLVYELLAKHCAGPRLELFAIGPREGWTTWGAEAEKPIATARKSKIYTATDERLRAS